MPSSRASAAKTSRKATKAAVKKQVRAPKARSKAISKPVTKPVAKRNWSQRLRTGLAQFRTFIGRQSSRFRGLALADKLLRTGASLIVLSLIAFTILFYPEIGLELGYWVHPPNANARVVLAEGNNSGNPTSAPQDDIIVPVDENFDVIIPKIGANANVIPDVDPYNFDEYHAALAHGVAHAKGTVYPGMKGNVFLFAHSAVNFYEANRLNVHFYLLSKLAPGDIVDMVYNHQLFTYKVSEVKIVDPHDVQYLANQDFNKATVTLMTCWPAGTDVDRTLVIAELVQ